MRKKKWEQIRNEINEKIKDIKTDDKDIEVMKQCIMSHLYLMTETEKTFNDVLDILNKNKTRVFRRDRE